MKSIHTITVIAVIMTLLLSGLTSAGESTQKSGIDKYLTVLSNDVTLVEDGPQAYRMTTIWHNRGINGDATAKFVITGNYTRALGDGMVRWNNVQIRVFGDPSQPESDTIPQEWMENFTYKSPDDIADQELFFEFPSDESTHLLRTLVWDAIAFEVFAWDYFDQLKLNEPLTPADFANMTVQMADWGTIGMKDLRLTWLGISKMNGEICALIQCESFMNPVRSLGITGRSLYWGRIWVSLEDKQIEYGKFNEDVNMEMGASDDSKRFLNVQREVEFKRIK